MTEFDAQPGDIFACWGADWVSRFISFETSSAFGPTRLRWAPSHVAIACPLWYPHHEEGCYWWESTMLTKRRCLEAGRPVRGVQVHGIRDRIGDYVLGGGRVSVYRLCDFYSLNEQSVRQLRSDLGFFLGDGDDDSPPRNYDTAGAILSGTRIVRRISAWRNQLDSLFCSELLASVLQKQHFMPESNPSRFHPGRLLRELVASGRYQFSHEYRCPDSWRASHVRAS